MHLEFTVSEIKNSLAPKQEVVKQAKPEQEYFDEFWSDFSDNDYEWDQV